MSRTFSFLFALAFAALLSTSAQAAANAGGYAVELVDVAGRTLTTYHHGGQVYVLGTYGQRYNVRVVNRTGRRIEAVITIDGRDAISGDQGSYSQRGYIIDAWGSVSVEGFRQSNNNVAAFRFTSPGDSYSARRGTAQNVGVIGVAVFKEKHRRPKPIARRKVKRPSPRFGYNRGGGAKIGDMAAESAPAPAARKTRGRAQTRSNLGTQYGESVNSSVVEVRFRRTSSRPSNVLSLYYDNYAGLQAKGVVPAAYAPPPTPNPFPARYAPPPPGY